MELYPRKCLITGNGFNQGFKVGDVYIELKKHVNPYCKVHHKMTFQQLYEEGQEEFTEVDSDFAYFSKWDDDDILEQGFGYDEQGLKVYVSESKKDEDLKLFLQMLKNLNKTVVEIDLVSEYLK